MKKILPVIFVLVVVGIGAFIFMNRGASDTSTDVTSPDSSTPDTFSGTLKDAIKLGVAMKCTYEVEGNEYESFIKGENYRGKIKTAEGETGEVIIKNNCMWTWSEKEAQGIKTCFEEPDTETFEESDTETADVWEQPQGGVGPDITYTCLPAAVTDAKFTPPSNIDFIDLDAMTEGFGY